MSNKIFPIIISVALLSGTIFGGSILKNFTGYPFDNGIMLEWDSGVEVNLSEYQIERSAPGGTYTYIGKVNPLGSESHYSYYDQTVFAKIASRTYNYRIKIIDADADKTFSYSSVISVSPTLSSARETWGSIKALFR